MYSRVYQLRRFIKDKHHLLKELRKLLRFAHLEKVKPTFSISSFTICVNLLLKDIVVPSWNSIISLMFLSYLNKLLFSGFCTWHK